MDHHRLHHFPERLHIPWDVVSFLRYPATASTRPAYRPRKPRLRTPRGRLASGVVIQSDTADAEGMVPCDGNVIHPDGSTNGLGCGHYAGDFRNTRIIGASKSLFIITQGACRCTISFAQRHPLCGRWAAGLRKRRPLARARLAASRQGGFMDGRSCGLQPAKACISGSNIR